MTSTAGGLLLRARGVRPGDRIALALPNGWRYAVAYYGVQLAGAVAVLVNTRFAPPETEYELIRELIDRAIGGNPGSDLAADLAAIDGSFGILAGEDAFARGRDERMGYLARLADA